MNNVDWIAVDWGTSNLRIWAMAENGTVLDSISTDQGMACLTPNQFEPILISHINPWLTQSVTPVVACGMVGSRQGWIEAPYDNVPTHPGTRTVTPTTIDPRIDVRIIAGLQQLEPADVMRGEETQIAGYLSDNPDFNGTLCLPGTHSKWATVANGRVTHFQTALTGELFSLLTSKSVLRHSMLDWDDAAFKTAVSHSFATPQNLITRLFGIRANHLLNGDETGKSCLSGMIVGAELAGLKSMWQDQKTIIIGAGGLANLYNTALATLGAKTEMIPVEEMTLTGLKKIHKELFT